MELIISSREFTASAKLIQAAIHAAPSKSANMRDVLIQLDELTAEISHFNNVPVEDLMNGTNARVLADHLTERFGESNGVYSCEFVPQSCGTKIDLSFVFNEEVLVKASNMLAEEVEGLSGVLITLYGAVKMLSFGLKRICTRLKDIVEAANDPDQSIY